MAIAIILIRKIYQVGKDKLWVVNLGIIRILACMARITVQRSKINFIEISLLLEKEFGYGNIIMIRH